MREFKKFKKIRKYQKYQQLVEKPPAGRFSYKLTPFLAALPPKIKIGQSKALPRFLDFQLC